ncbi:aminotransferase class V-fold PLP-dependent enzyme [Streptomyces sp. NPDC090022]|uniref:aminotransferase class V-fold PLP-dependent enzyme n=1 Tax=Streptomyces sp. NPDC090022 TaxID=3365920 RepID=UPI0038082EE0
MNATPHRTPPGFAPLLPVLSRDVNVPTSHGDITYAALDYAASTPLLEQVWEEVAAFAPRYGSVHRGSGHLARHSTSVFEGSREEVARFLGLRPDDRVVFTRSTTDSLNLLANCLPDDSTVYAFDTEHHAALLPWPRDRLVLLAAPGSPQQAVESLDRALLKRRRPGTDLVCVTGASNVTGELWPVKELADTAHQGGARIVLDAAQLAPHRPISVSDLDVDWVALSGHKLYAPFGAGVLAGRWDWPRQAEPYLAGGGASDSVRRVRNGLEIVWNDGVARHEAGTPNVIGALALASACRTLRAVGFDALKAHEDHLLGRALAGIHDAPGTRLLRLFPDGGDRVPVLTFVVDGMQSLALAESLSEEYGIGVRAGLFCAHPLMHRLLDGDATCAAASQGCEKAPVNAVRVSFGAGTPDEHVSRFVNGLRELIERLP